MIHIATDSREYTFAFTRELQGMAYQSSSSFIVDGLQSIAEETFADRGVLGSDLAFDRVCRLPRMLDGALVPGTEGSH